MRPIAKKLIFFSTLPFVFSACGGGGGGAPSARPAGTISGYVMVTPVVGANINIYDFSSGSKGERIDRGDGSDIHPSDGNGQFSVDVVNPSEYVMIEAEGGRYIDPLANEGNGVDILNSGAGFKAIVRYTSGQSNNVQLTPYTHWAACLAEYYIEQGTAVGSAINRANDEISLWLDLSGDSSALYDTRPANVINDRADIDLQTLKYGYFSAGLTGLASIYAEQADIDLGNSPFTALRIMSIGCSDLQNDGQFDGDGVPTSTNLSGELTFGGEIPGDDSANDVTANFYRAGIARGMLIMAEADFNQDGLRPDQLFNDALKIADNNSAIFDSRQEPEPIDVTPPQITVIDTVDGEGNAPVVAERGAFRFRIEDNIAIGLVRVTIEDLAPIEYEPSLLDFTAQPVMLNYDVRGQFAPGSGEVDVLVEAYDLAAARDVNLRGNPAHTDTETATYFMVGENTPAMTSPKLVNVGVEGYDASGVFVDGLGTVKSASIQARMANSNEVFPGDLDNEAGTWVVNNIPLPPNETTKVTFTITDTDNETHSTEESISVDTISPRLDQRGADVFAAETSSSQTCTSITISTSFNPTSEICFNNDNDKFDGVNPGFDTLIQRNFAVIRVSATDPNPDPEDGVSTPAEQMVVRYEYSTCNEQDINDCTDDPVKTGVLRSEFGPEFPNTTLTPSERYLPLTEESLVPGFARQTDVIHKIQLISIDGAQNENPLDTIYYFQTRHYEDGDIPGIPGDIASE